MKKNGFTPLIIILVIAILGVVGCLVYRNYSTQKIASLTTPASTQTPFPENLRDVSLENYLKNKLYACVEYSGENKCDKTQNYAIIQIINKNYAYGGFGNDQTGFQFVAVKINGNWTEYYTGGGGMPNCSEITNLPPGIFGEDILNACFDGNQTIVRTTGKPLVPTNLTK